jgi:hypothetical protein
MPQWVVPGKRYRSEVVSWSSRSGLPAAARQLSEDNPVLRDLEARYGDLGDPPAAPWGSHGLSPYFRGDNDYVWQYRYFSSDFRKRLRHYARYVVEADTLGGFGRCAEDGAFGCYTTRFRGKRISRDLVDSVHQLNWLCRHLPVLRGGGVRAVDIGAGYGRLAHRISEVFGSSWLTVSTDGVARSTFLSDFYLKYRDCVGSEVIPADQIAEYLPRWKPTLAINIHSFSEMKGSAIDWWLRLLEESGCPNLLVVTNDTDESIRSLEADFSRPDITPLFARRGFRLIVQEPYVLDTTVRQETNVRNYFSLFGRAAANPP